MASETTTQNAELWHVRKHPRYGNWCVYQQNSSGDHSINFKTEAEAQAKLDEWRAVGICGECGDVLNDGYMEPSKTEIRTKQRCLGCLFWLRYVATRDDKTHAIVNGQHYVITPDAPRAAFQGHGGARFDIRFKDGREVTTCNLWAQGRIPERFRERLPDNAEFVTRGHRRVNTLSLHGGYVGPGSADAQVEG